ncbi:TPA: hypothetical protein ACYLN4_001086 [Burkholderia lata]
MYNLDLFDESPAVDAAGGEAPTAGDSAGDPNIAEKPESDLLENEEPASELSSEAESPAAEAAGREAPTAGDSSGDPDIAEKPESERPENEEHAGKFSSEAMHWVIEEIESIADAGNSKTRLKTIKASDDLYRGLLDACLLVAWRKRLAYEKARTGELFHWDTGSIGWVQQDPELAAAFCLLTRAAIPLNELSMLPPAFMPHQA